MNNIDYRRVLEKTENGYLIFAHILKGQLKKKNETRCHEIKSPLYNDTNASLSIYFYPKTNTWCFKDFGQIEHKGNALAFAALYYKIDIKKNFPELLEKINEELKLDIQNENPVRIKKRTKYESPNGGYILFERNDDSKYTTEELWFLNQYGISKVTANHFGMIPIDGYEVTNNDGLATTIIRKPDQLLFAYIGDGFAKIYSPAPSKFFRYLGSKPAGYIFGKKNLTTMDMREEVVFITGGEKDVITLAAHGYHAVCLNSETASLSDELLELLNLLYENVVVLYDIDETGLKSSEILCEKHNLKRMILPLELITRGLGKDISDYCKVLHNPKELAKNADIVGAELFNTALKAVIDGANINEKTTGLTKINVEGATEYADFELIESTVNKSNVPIRTANQRLLDAKNMPPITALIGVFWHTNELAIVFGDTGLGKSLLAVDIADKISKGMRFLGLENETTPLKVLYFDFELSDKQFQKRYSDENEALYEFSSNFYIDTIDFTQLAETNSTLSFDELLYNKILESIINTGAQVLIIDNITFLKAESSHDGKVALDIMRQLCKLKKEFNISILVLAHTPKRPPANGITISDLAGSKHLSNFADSVFAIGKSAKDKNLRYLKQVKPSRSAECMYDSENVIICELSKKDKGLFFELIGFGPEQQHLSNDGEMTEEKFKEKALELQKAGMTLKQIGAELGKSKSTIGRLLQK